MRRAFSPFSRRGGETASVLIVVMWVCLGLISITLLFSNTSLLNYRASGNDFAARQADAAVEGALRYAEYTLSNGTTPGGFPSPDDYTAESVPLGDARFWYLGRGEDTDNGQVRIYGLVDEAGKLNLNTATVDMLQELPGITPDFAEAIVDWRSTKGGDIESEDELYLIDGADPLVIEGEDSNLNGVLDPNENDGSQNDPPDNSDGKLDPGLLEYVTVFSQEPKMRASGAGERFDVRNGLTQDQADTLKSEHSGVSDIPAGAGAYTSPLDFMVQTSMAPADFDLIYGDLTAGQTRGLINVNTARESVLRCIPGLESLATDLVNARLARTQPDTSLSWVVDVLGPATAQAVGKYLTGRSYQATADIAAVGQGGRGYRRTRFVIDTRNTTPTVIYRRDLSALGWALGSDVRQQFAGQATLPTFSGRR